MKKLLLFLLGCLFLCEINAQNAQLEKSIFGVQTGLLGVWFHNESRIAPSIALRSEVGFDAGFFKNAWVGDGFVMAPTITLEPRYYYNIKNRETKGKTTHNNAFNFVSLDIGYVPNWFLISNVKNAEMIPSISFVPKWGIRRNIGQHFNYEAGVGLGYQYTFAKSQGYLEDEQGLVINLHVRIGYTF